MSLSILPLNKNKISESGSTLSKVITYWDSNYDVSRYFTIEGHQQYSYQLHYFLLDGYDGITKIFGSMAYYRDEIIYKIDENYIYTISFNNINDATFMYEKKYDKVNLTKVYESESRYNKFNKGYSLFWGKSDKEGIAYELCFKLDNFLNGDTTSEGKWIALIREDEVKYMCLGLGYCGLWGDNKEFSQSIWWYTQGVINSELHNVGNSQIINVANSDKIISQVIDGKRKRFLTEDMVIDNSKIDISKAMTIVEGEPKILTEECLKG